jgi:ribose transport system permease protein
MKKVVGIFGLLVAICVATAIAEPKFFAAYNVQNQALWIGLFGIISIGVSFVIITGGIDLSIGSVIGLVASLLPHALNTWHWSPAAALAGVMVLSVGIGLLHGLLITKMRLQPFVVTLCGLLFYRGLARWMTGDETQGFGAKFDGLRSIATGKLPLVGKYMLPYPFLVMLIIALLAAVLLNRTVFGRYLLALGRNEQAARYSGINTDRMIIWAYVICSTLAGLGGILFSLDINSVQPSGYGNFYELYAIAAAVLGGCSLRGGEGSILGVVIGTAVMRLLNNSISLLGIPSQLEFAIIGVVILAGVLADELVKRWAAARRSRKSSGQ